MSKPIDYQLDTFIDVALRRSHTIEELLDLMEAMGSNREVRTAREKNLKESGDTLRSRKQEFLEEFWAR